MFGLRKHPLISFKLLAVVLALLVAITVLLMRSTARATEYDGPNSPSNQELQSGCQALPADVAITITVGDVTISATPDEEVPVLPNDPNFAWASDYCHYRVHGVGSVAANILKLKSFANVQIPVPALETLDVDFYKLKNPNRNDLPQYRMVTVLWSDEGTEAGVLFDIKGVQFLISDLQVTLDQTAVNAGVSVAGGAISCKLNASKDNIKLAPAVYIGGNLVIEATYTFTANQGWTGGNWSFGGSGSTTIEVRRDGSGVLASGTLTFNQDNFAATLTACTPTDGVNIAGLKVKLAGTVSFHTNYSDWSTTLDSIALTGTMDMPKPTSGSLSATFGWNASGMTVSISNTSPLQAFGLVCDPVGLTVHLNPNTLEFTQVDGSFGFKIPSQTGNSLTVTFNMQNGVIQQFTASGGITYRQFSVTLTSLGYTASDPEAPTHACLSISASMTLGWTGNSGSLDLTKFKVREDGTITEVEFTGNITTTPVTITLHGKFKPNEVSGDFTGKFGGLIDINGSIVYGREVDPDNTSQKYTYGLFSLGVNVGSGIALGPTGLKLLGLNGALGFNYLPVGAPASVGSTPGPAKGTYYVKGGITIGDVFGIASLTGELAFTIQPNAVSVGITGTIRVTQSTTYFSGTLDIQWTLGGDYIHGSISTTVKIPSSGSIIDINNNTVNFGFGNTPTYGNNTWFATGSNLGGTFLSAVNVTNGNIDLHGNLTNPISSMTGHISCNLSGDKTAVISWPDGFRPYKANPCNGTIDGCCFVSPQPGGWADYWCADSTDTWGGLGFSVGYTLNLDGQLDVNLDSNGISGQFDTHISFSGYGACKWTFSDVHSAQFNAAGTVHCQLSGSQIHVWGTLDFTNGTNGGTESVTFDVTTSN